MAGAADVLLGALAQERDARLAIVVSVVPVDAFPVDRTARNKSNRATSPVGVTASLTMPFYELHDLPTLEIIPGCRTRIPYGQNLMLSYLQMDEGAEVPLHSHPHEQGGILLEGRLRLTIGDETRDVQRGALFIIPPNVPHRAVAIGGPATVLDVFSPVREDYAEMYNKYVPGPTST